MSTTCDTNIQCLRFISRSSEAIFENGYKIIIINVLSEYLGKIFVKYEKYDQNVRKTL